VIEIAIIAGAAANRILDKVGTLSRPGKAAIPRIESDTNPQESISTRYRYLQLTARVDSQRPLLRQPTSQDLSIGRVPLRRFSRAISEFQKRVASESLRMGFSYLDWGVRSLYLILTGENSN
jgi:hypothetical protein